jgi:hypothetical protein
MPKSIIREMPPEEQAQRLAALRRARYGDLLAELASDRCGRVASTAAGYRAAPFFTGNHRPATFVLARGRMGEFSGIRKKGCAPRGARMG